MARTFLVPINLSQLELQNALLHLIAGNPGSPVEGQLWYDSVAKKLKYRTNVANIDPTDRANHAGTQTASTVSDLAATVKAYRLDEFAAPNVSVGLGSQKLTSLADGTADSDGATVGQLRAMVNGLDWKASVRAATTANITLSGTQTIDGISLAVGEHCLVKNQTTGAENGIYTVASGAWTRRADADSSTEVTSGLVVPVSEGTVNADTAWVLTTNDPITLNTTALAFSQLPGGGETVLAGAGLTKTSSTLDVGEGIGIDVSADAIAIDTAVVARKYSADCAAAVSTTVTHNLGTRDVQVSVRRATSPWDKVDVDDEADTANSVIVRFAVAPSAGAFRITVTG